MDRLIGKTAKFNGLACKIIDVVQGKTKQVAKVVYPEVKAGAESVYIVWGSKKYNVLLENLSFE